MPIGLVVPLQLRADGTFEITRDPVRILRQRIIDLLATSRWQRVHRSTYGCDLEEFLFTSVLSHVLVAKAEEIKNTLNNALSYGKVLTVVLYPYEGPESAVVVQVQFSVYQGGGVETLEETFLTTDEGVS